MENLYLAIIVLLFLLAISDLIVGVSNDAVNFLNSAIGSKVASFRTIMIIAAVGIIFGATFSNGMMEVARKGIFHPDMFVFSEIIIIFLAVMMTDIILLDLFNTLGLPTSTTVSIVFELLGAAVAISLLKIINIDGSINDLPNYINSEKALQIIMGILLSVFIAFSIGALIQYIIRLAFSFNWKKSYKYFGALWGGIAITAIVFFILVKGIKGSAFSDYEVGFDMNPVQYEIEKEKNDNEINTRTIVLTEKSVEKLHTEIPQNILKSIKMLEGNKYPYHEFEEIIISRLDQKSKEYLKPIIDASYSPLTISKWIKKRTNWIILFCFIGFTFILELIRRFTRFNILKFIVLVGTFALAMAFAGNDLVNFIGVPLAGFDSYLHYAGQGLAADQYSMEALKNPVQTKTIYLVIAGLIMVATLWLSKKARSVVKTTIDLSRQVEGEERFRSNVLSRVLVRTSVLTAQGLKAITPPTLSKKIEKRFESIKENKNDNDAPAFDLVRASVNLVVASILISIGTALKIPLSTTYVTFMVAMGTSLSDRAWGRESAVYRISGVITVIGGWFVTAMVAFTVAFTIAMIIYFGEIYAIGFMVLVAIFLLYRTNVIHKSKDTDKKEKEKLTRGLVKDKKGLYNNCNNNLIDQLKRSKEIVNRTFDALPNENRTFLKKNSRELKKLIKEINNLKDTTHIVIRNLEEDQVDTGYFYVQVLDHMIEFNHSIRHIFRPIMEYIDNNHPPLIEEQINDLKTIKENIIKLFDLIINDLQNKKFEDLDIIYDLQFNTVENIKLLKKAQIKQIKKEKTGTRSSVLCLGIQTETKNMILYLINVIQAQIDFNFYVYNSDSEINLKK